LVTTTSTQTLTVTDAGDGRRAGNVTGVTTSAVAASHFSVTAPSSVTAGTAFSFTVTALNASNGTTTGYTGTVHFTKSDSGGSVRSEERRVGKESRGRRWGNGWSVGTV